MSKKAAILQAATLLFSEKGFKFTSMADICRMTGVAEGTIFYHFKNKEEIFLAILEKAKDELISEFQRHLAEKTFATGLERIEAIIGFHIDLAGSKEVWFKLLHQRFPYELATTNPVCRQHLEAIYNCLVDLFQQAMLIGQQDGSIAEMPARKVAMILFAMVDGLVRFNSYNFYDTGALYSELVASTRRMLQPFRKST
jgi:AcrR family transcriptional regulator